MLLFMNLFFFGFTACLIANGDRNFLTFLALVLNGWAAISQGRKQASEQEKTSTEE